MRLYLWFSSVDSSDCRTTRRRRLRQTIIKQRRSGLLHGGLIRALRLVEKTIPRFEAGLGRRSRRNGIGAVPCTQLTWLECPFARFARLICPACSELIVVADQLVATSPVPPYKNIVVFF